MQAESAGNRRIVKPSSLQWIALALLVLSVAINYADRGNLGVALRSIQTDLHLNAEDLGSLSSAFFWAYALFQLLAGVLIDRWNVNWVYAAGFLLWSAATGAIGLANSFVMIFSLRLLLGLGESIAYPAYSKIIATSFPENLRGTANGFIDVGSKVGPALGVLVSGLMIARFGWRGMFIAIGGVSLLWLIPWCIVAAKIPSRAIEKASERAPGYGQLLSKRCFWGTALGLFGGNYGWYFFLSWLPYYFERERHYHKDELALVGSIPFWAIALSAFLAGMIADAIIRRGREAGRVRQTFLCVGLLGCCAFLMPAVAVQSARTANVLLVAASLCMGLWSSNHWALTQRLSGPAAAGRWTACQNCIGNFAGVAGGEITGAVLHHSHSFLAAFAIACGFMVLGVIGYSFVIGRPTEVHWLPATVLSPGEETKYIG